MATVLYLLAAICCVLAWVGQRVALTRAATWIVWMGVAAQFVGIVMRMEITGRPPITNLYSSFLFVSMATVVLLQVVERFSREGFGTLLGAVFGVATMLWAFSSSVADGDTMIVLRAVLDTQFWLSTHVICISMGYAATAAAGMTGLYWTVRSLFDDSLDQATSRKIIQNVYGITAFALLLSFFGTVLGGLWGDDSWGRFWGWDPKENGALMIVLWNAVTLHARWAGIARDRGIAALSIFGIVVTIWSWECVNQLGVGLHSYGVSAGKLQMVLSGVAIFSAVSLLGFVPRKLWRSPAVNGRK
jgi:ABC-type transport system involved in cytochrome c biogenesis permease subunit